MWQPEPTRVTSPSFVAAFTVTNSRMVVPFPISTRGVPPLNFRSCVCCPILANGNTSHFSPRVVAPAITTCDIRRVPAPSRTFAPTTQ
ncbi:MAG: hypothetical protein BWY59_01244 [Verrucomicrobia bacterium ADurb.Bin345]|nr:MAG: hypothetical protein BWY59_01244 [Verrucomicrobia bacterium ADurb.Bin345]